MKFFDTAFEYLIYLYIIIQPLVPTKFKIGPVPFNGDAVLAFIILCYLVKIAADRASRKKFAGGLRDFFTHSLGLSMAVIIAVMFFSVTYSTDKTLALRESARFTTYIILYFIIKYEIAGEKAKKNMIMVYFAVCFLVYSIGIFEFANAARAMGTLKYTWQLRTDSTVGNYNNLGTFAIISLFPSVMLFLGEKKRGLKAFYVLLSLMAFANLLVSFSRNALLGLMLGFLLLILFYSYKFIIVFVISLGIALIVPVTRMRIFQIADMSQNESRLKVWKTAIYMIKDHFLLGVGNGNFYSQYWFYVNKHPEELYNEYDLTQVLHPHNIFLKIQSELGIFGSLAFLGILVSNFAGLIKFIKSEKNPFLNHFFKGIIISFAVFIFMNLIDNFFSAPQVVAFFWIFTAVYQSLEYNRSSSELRGA